MQLRYNKSIRKNIVIVDLEAVGFTPRELESFKRFGEPIIEVEKLYPIESDKPLFPVKIFKKLRSAFKIRVKFDGTEDIEAACIAAESFYTDIKAILEEALLESIDKLEDSLTYDLGSGVDIISSGEESYIPPEQLEIFKNPQYHVMKPDCMSTCNNQNIITII